MRFRLLNVYLLAGLSAASCGSTEGRFTVANRATEPIKQIVVTICGQTIALGPIDPQRTAVGAYNVTSDSHFVIDLTFVSGKTLHKEDGYVTNGVAYRHEIVVKNSEITLVVIEVS